jgi:hypothetical protein
VGAWTMLMEPSSMVLCTMLKNSSCAFLGSKPFSE